MKVLDEFLEIRDGTLRIPKRVVEQHGIKKIFVGTEKGDKEFDL